MMVAAFTQEEMRRDLLRLKDPRLMTLKILYSIPGFSDASRETRNHIYDIVIDKVCSLIGGNMTEKIKFVRQYQWNGMDMYDVAYESGVIRTYDVPERVPESAVKFMEKAYTRHEKHPMYGYETIYEEDNTMVKVVKMEQAYWVIVQNPNEGMPPEMMMYETTDLDEAVHIAKNQYGSAPQAKGIHAFVVLRDRWLEGDKTPLVDIQPD